MSESTPPDYDPFIQYVILRKVRLNNDFDCLGFNQIKKVEFGSTSCSGMSWYDYYFIINM